MSKAQYLKLPVFHRVGEVKALVLVPGSEKGHLSLSGESMDVEPVGVEIHAGVMRVCVPGWLDESEWMKAYE
jgi:hypothetical protein